ncbi:hypothetical protein F5Y11DRAFT_143260 [Daldinia sp. FL1419]|nr:hypothetical protein F5Y11DRAFT_143260 [Daldinia sp. FL1419]
MAINHSPIYCRALWSRPTAVIAVSYGSDDLLRNVMVSGDSQQGYLDLDYPEEGIYVIFQDRAMQIAASSCDKRKCSISRICRCDVPKYSVKRPLPSRPSFKRYLSSWSVRKPCLHCLLTWMRLYQAAEAANRFGLQFLQYPRTLTSISLFDHYTFFHDYEIEELSRQSNCNGSLNRPIEAKAHCSSRQFQWMLDAWDEFVDAKCYEPGYITAISTIGVDTEEEDVPQEDSGWDDFGFPLKPAPAPAPLDNEEYDTFDDIIKEEFPKLSKFKVPTAEELDSIDSTIGGATPSEEQDDPVPAVIPPKGMNMARCFGTRLMSDGSVVPLSLEPMEPSIATRAKRSYSDAIELGKRDEALAEEISRIKNRKRNAGKTYSLNRWFSYPVMSPASRLKRGPKKLSVSSS